MLGTKEFREDIVKAMLPHMILTIVDRQKTIHGYWLIRYIRKVYGVYLGPSTIYPILNNLEAQGLLASEWAWGKDNPRKPKRPRKLYHITAKGKAFLIQTNTILTFVNKMVITA